MSVRKTILLVDEDKTSSLYLGIILKRMGFGVAYAESGPDALKLIKEVRPELVLMQADMSKLSGPDTLRAIRKDAKLGHTPAIIMSANMDMALVRRCAEAGSNGFMSLPVRMDELHGILQEFVLSASGVRRRHMRTNARISVTLYKDGASRQFTTEAVSEGGLFLLCDRPYPVLSEVQISIPAPDRDMKVKGLVIYHRSTAGGDTSVPPGMAVEFVGLNRDESASLRMLVNKLMTGGMDKDPEDQVRGSGNAGGKVFGLRRGAM